MLIDQILMFIFELSIAELAALVAPVPRAVMFVIVLGPVVFSSYSVQTAIGDVYFMGALGLEMYFLERFDFSAASLVLDLTIGGEPHSLQGFYQQ